MKVSLRWWRHLKRDNLTHPVFPSLDIPLYAAHKEGFFFFNLRERSTSAAVSGESTYKTCISVY